MKNQYPKWLRTLLAMFILFSSIGINATVLSAADEMKEAARKMTTISSVSGNSIAEEFYKRMGGVYVHLADVIKNSIGVVLVAGIVISVMMLYPVIVEIMEKIKAAKIKVAEIQASQLITAQNTASENRQSAPKCSNCGMIVNKDDSFCPSCGNKMEQNKNE